MNLRKLPWPEISRDLITIEIWFWLIYAEIRFFIFLILPIYNDKKRIIFSTGLIKLKIRFLKTSKDFA